MGLNIMSNVSPLFSTFSGVHLEVDLGYWFSVTLIAVVCALIRVFLCFLLHEIEICLFANNHNYLFWYLMIGQPLSPHQVHPLFWECLTLTLFANSASAVFWISGYCIYYLFYFILIYFIVFYLFFNFFTPTDLPILIGFFHTSEQRFFAGFPNHSNNNVHIFL